MFKFFELYINARRGKKVVSYIGKLKSKIIQSKFMKLFLRNIILLESNPDYADNTKGVFDALIEEGINNKCKIIWFVKNENDFKDIKIHNVYFYSRDNTKSDKSRFKYYNTFSKYIIDCNNYIKKKSQHQFRIHLTHGTPIKVAKDYGNQCGDTDYVIQASDFFTNVTKELFLVKDEQVISTGLPRNDILFYNDKIDFFPEVKRKKTITWFPTYRNHKMFKGKNDATYNMKINFKYGIPLIEDKDDLIKLNTILKNKDILLLIKLHPVEDESVVSEFKLDNIKLIKEEMFLKNHTNLFNVFANSDALITDYSSVYYDFLLTKKPIGLAIPDLEEYKKHVNLMYDDYEKNIIGEYLYSFDDLINFINNISNDKDNKYDLRMEKLKLYYKYTDGNSSHRVVELLKKNMW